LLPSEFKGLWESVVNDSLIEAFDSLFYDYLLLANLTQDTIKVVYEETIILLNNKVKHILSYLNIKDNSKRLDSLIRNIFQENSNSIFEFQDDFFNIIKEKMLKKAKEYKNTDDNFISDYETDTSSKYYKTLIQQLFKISIYMLLHDPILTLNIENYENRKLTYMYYNKNDLMNIEGFGNENTPCVVILHPPILKKNYPYQGIKPVVYMIPNPSEFVKQEADKNAIATALVGVVNNKNSMIDDKVIFTDHIKDNNPSLDNSMNKKTHHEKSNSADIKLNINKEVKIIINDNIIEETKILDIADKSSEKTFKTNKTDTDKSEIDRTDKTSDFNFPLSKPDNKKVKVVSQNFFLNTESFNKEKGNNIN